MACYMYKGHNVLRQRLVKKSQSIDKIPPCVRYLLMRTQDFCPTLLKINSQHFADFLTTCCGHLTTRCKVSTTRCRICKKVIKAILYCCDALWKSHDALPKFHNALPYWPIRTQDFCNSVAKNELTRIPDNLLYTCSSHNGLQNIHKLLPQYVMTLAILGS